ncbi:DUF309 domain-containing protein [Cyanobium sp. HWJ4-Hawea]|uniref:DUF309 domain-containing protein n=1 Tax=Cyanobium sp. HWJ4-Hawea TaxID=2823713 RepID=UPI0020CE8F0A|nr:DUF309 domain-containing protein [Cyanobium sp. HWJ4-Hawea]MCP9809113.1 DUF309 domain-containing protein [Cyanobium sp. HWJ4-Hawea]
MASPHGSCLEEELLMADPRLGRAIELFNQGEWYACHDCLEELWHETAGPMRPVLHGVLQMAVAELHLETGNLRGATLLLGEALGRLKTAPDQALGLDLKALQVTGAGRLDALHRQSSMVGINQPKLTAAQQE